MGCSRSSLVNDSLWVRQGFRGALAGLMILCLWGFTGSARSFEGADPVILQENLEVGSTYKIELNLNLQGELRIQADKDTRKIPIQAQGTHQYLEKVLTQGETSGIQGPARMARLYQKAEATITEAGEKTTRSLRSTRKLFLAQRGKDQLWVVCPEGPLTRSEQELTSDQFDTMALCGILPGTKLGVDGQWRLHNTTVNLICHFEGLIEQDLSGKVVEIQGDQVTFAIDGKASGIDLGAMVKAKIEARGTFDSKTKTITSLEWKQTEEREPGPVNPSATLTSTLKLSRQRIEAPETLSENALAKFPAEDKEIPEHLRALEYRDSKGRFELIHGREWQLVAETENHLVLRLMDRGDFIAQCTITPWTSAPKGKHMSPEDFRAAMAKTPGWAPNKELLADEIPAGEGRYLFRIAAQGQMDGAEVVQHFFLVAAPTGEQAIMTFTMSPRMVEKLGARDVNLVGGLLVPASAVEVESKKE